MQADDHCVQMYKHPLAKISYTSINDFNHLSFFLYLHIFKSSFYYDTLK